MSDREVAGRVASERREPGRAATAGAAKRTSGGRTSAGRTSAAGHTSAGGRVAQGVGGPAAPVQGTAALKLDAAGTEPLRVTDTAAAAPRLRVAPPAPIVAPRTPFIALVIALVVAGVLGILLINTKTNENSFQIDTLQDQQAALDNQQQELDNQLAVYNSAGNLDAAAKRQGLVKAEAPAYIRLPDGRVIGVPKPASGRPAVTAQDADDVATAPQGPATAPAAAPNTPTGVTQGEVQNGGAQPDAGAAGPGAAGPDAAGSGAAGSGAAGSGAAGSGAAGSGAALPGAGQ